MGNYCVRTRPERVSPPPIAPAAPKIFDDVLNSDGLRALFRKFLAKRYASENFAFYEGMELYEKMGVSENALKYYQRAGEGLVNKFVVQESSQGVNISGPTRERLLDVSKFDKSTFSVAKKELHELLSSNFFQPFRFELEKT